MRTNLQNSNLPFCRQLQSSSYENHQESEQNLVGTLSAVSLSKPAASSEKSSNQFFYKKKSTFNLWEVPSEVIMLPCLFLVVVLKLGEKFWSETNQNHRLVNAFEYLFQTTIRELVTCTDYLKFSTLTRCLPNLRYGCTTGSPRGVVHRTGWFSEAIIYLNRNFVLFPNIAKEESTYFSLKEKSWEEN